MRAVGLTGSLSRVVYHISERVEVILLRATCSWNSACLARAQISHVIQSNFSDMWVAIAWEGVLIVG